MGTGVLYARGGNPAMHMDIQGRVQFLLVASCYRYQDKLRLYVWATSLTQCLPTFHSVTTITGIAGVTVCFSYLHHLISFLFFFSVPFFQVTSALIEVSGVTNSSVMACVLSMRTICCTGARRRVTFVVQVQRDFKSGNNIQIRKPSL